MLARLAAAAVDAILTDERLDVEEQVKGHLELAVCTFLEVEIEAGRHVRYRAERLKRSTGANKSVKHRTN